MSKFGSLFGGGAGTATFYRRVIDSAARSGAYDLLRDESYQEVIDELMAGRDIKAAQVYCERFSAPVDEGRAAVAELRFLINQGRN